MELKFKKIMAIVVLLGLACTCYAEDEPEPNKPAIVNADSPSERSEVELTTEPVRKGDKSTDQIEVELAKEYYKDCVQNLKWALGIIVGLVVVLFGFVSFKGSKEHRETLADAKEALREARSASDKARDYEEKAQERLSGIDKEVANKLKEIEEKGKALVTELTQESEKQRETSREEAEKERKASEFWNMGLRAVNAKDFESAANYFAATVEFMPEEHTAYCNWSAALCQLAQQKEGAESDKLFRQAIEKCKKAIKIKPEYHSSYINWGAALFEMGKRRKGPEVEKLLEQAIEKFEKAIEIKPDAPLAYSNCGSTLGRIAKQKEGSEAEELLEQALEKFEKAVEINPDYTEAWNSWGCALLDLSKYKENEEKTKFLEEANKKCLKAESIKQGTGAYNLACISALLGDEIECKKWLETSEKAGTIVTCKKAMSDPDLESVRDKEWFKQLRWADDAK